MNPGPPGAWKRIGQFGLGLMLAVLAVRAADLLARRTESLPPLPQPNGYLKLLEATGDTISPTRDFSELSNNDLKALAKQNEPALNRVREGLGMDCRVPLATSKGWSDKHDEELRKLKRLGLLFALEGKARMLAGETNELWRGDLDLIRLGQSISRGGIMVDGISGVTLETVGVASLQSRMAQLTAPACKEAAQTLEELETRRSSAEDVIENERRWSARSYGLIDRLGSILMRQALAKRRATFTTRYREIWKRTQRLEVRLASRACELESGRWPANPGELIPQYLKRLPVNPDSGRAVESAQWPAADSVQSEPPRSGSLDLPGGQRGYLQNTASLGHRPHIRMGTSSGV
jgi:hypothetical protein